MAGSGLVLEEVETPVGPVGLVMGPAGIARVRLPGFSPTFNQAAASAAGSSGPAESAALAREAARQVAAYFSGELHEFELPLDLGGVSGFQRMVLEAARRIPFGETASYREMAIAAGSPEAVRAAGTAMGANPVPLLIPCHRVIRSDGSPGLYGGGEGMKRWLLKFEQGAVAAAAA